MKLGYRITRAILFFIPAVLAMSTQTTLGGLSFVFAGTLFFGALITLIYLFLHFDEFVNPKIIMELLTDAFAGVVLITFPLHNGNLAMRYFLIIFSVWLFANGMFLAVSGIMDKENKPWFWLFVLVGIAYISMAFVIMNYNPEYISSAKWLVAFMMIIYGTIALFMLIVRKKDYFPPVKKE